MFGGLKKMIKNWLEIEKPVQNYLSVRAKMDYETNAFVNNVWYHGDSYELTQTYKQLSFKNNSFWESVPTPGQEIRKIHTGLPRVIVDSLVNVTLGDFEGVQTENETLLKILNENNYKQLINEALRNALVVGDGAFKISLDKKESNLPIVEFVPGDRLEYNYGRTGLKEIIFKSEHKDHQGENYILHESYGYGYITYQLFNTDGRNVPIDKIRYLADLVDVIFNTNLIMAHPFKVFENERERGRGRSIFDNKKENFDALDEIWSQWVDALRAGRSKTYIPADLLPRDPETGRLRKPNQFDNRYIATETSAKENAQSRIAIEQGMINDTAYLNTYVTALDLCLQGLISPSTLGIDTKKIENAEATREKEKTTLYTRSVLVKALQEELPQVFKKLFAVYVLDNNRGNSKEAIFNVEMDLIFGEYANPSFESQLEILGQAKQKGIISFETLVEELYGGSKNEEWKSEEVTRLKNEAGILEISDINNLTKGGLI